MRARHGCADDCLEDCFEHQLDLRDVATINYLNFREENLSICSVYTKYSRNGSNVFLQHSRDCLPLGSLTVTDGFKGRVFTFSGSWLAWCVKMDAM